MFYQFEKTTIFVADDVLVRVDFDRMRADSYRERGYVAASL